MNDTDKITAVPDSVLDKVTGGSETLRYSVRPGDTVDSIAAAYGVSADSIMLWNRFDRKCTLPRTIIIYK